MAIGCLASLPLLLALVAMSHSRAAACVRLRQVVDETILPLFERCGVLELAVISLFAGIGEELLFRGVIQTALGEWFSPMVGLAAASLLFGLAHPLTTAYAVVTALAGSIWASGCGPAICWCRSSPMPLTTFSRSCICSDALACGTAAD